MSPPVDIALRYAADTMFPASSVCKSIDTCLRLGKPAVIALFHTIDAVDAS